MKRHAFSKQDLESVIAFSQANPWKPQYPRALVRRFLTELISDEEMVFDFHDEKGRALTAVLLDRVNNPANDANLEIVGARGDLELPAAILMAVTLAKESVPANRSGFQASLAEGSPLHKAYIQFGLKEYYDTYEMSRGIAGFKAKNYREISPATMADRDAVYETLRSSFANTPDTSIVEGPIWKAGFLQSPAAHFYVWRGDQGILGFANLVEGGAEGAEIRTVGVLPEARGLGVGSKLLEHCMGESVRLGASKCHLTVAVTNQRALEIYLRAGFEIQEKYKCYRMPVR